MSPHARLHTLVHALAREGYTHAQIAQQLGVSSSLVGHLFQHEHPRHPDGCLVISEKRAREILTNVEVQP